MFSLARAFVSIWSRNSKVDRRSAECILFFRRGFEWEGGVTRPMGGDINLLLRMSHFQESAVADLQFRLSDENLFNFIRFWEILALTDLTDLAPSSGFKFF